MPCPIQTQMDDMLHRMSSESHPLREEIDRLLVVAARHTAIRLDEGNALMSETTRCLSELRGSHIHMQGELKDLREVVLTKHARELEALKADLADVRAAQSRVKWWASGACAVLIVMSHLNLSALAGLLK